VAKAQQLDKQHQSQIGQLDKLVKDLAPKVQQTEANLKALAPYLTASPTDKFWNPFSSSIKARLLPASVMNSNGHRGFHLWKPANGPLPIVGFSTAKKTLKIPGTLEPKMVVLHPPQRTGVAIAWRSPIKGRIRITGKVADAHACGDSIGWNLDHLNKRGFSALAGGSLTNVRRDDFANKKHAKLREVQVDVGDFIQFSILPQGSYGCDLTSVQIQIATLGKKSQQWDLSKSFTSGVVSGAPPNPHPDSRGVKSIWHMYGVPGHRGSKWFGKIAAVKDIAKAKAAAKRLSQQLSALRGRLTKAQRDLLRLRANGPYEVVYGVVEGKIADAPLQRRGNRRDLGPKVKRRNLAILGGQSITSPKTQSGRWELAQWITSKSNPLTTRVIANRVWQHHFGAGLVRTENDFGVRGEKPSHPKLLDWLADYLVRSNWSIKKLHRKIMLSSVYRLSSDYNAVAAKRDPSAKYLWRFNRRRLSAEEFRDTLLHLAGSLDRSKGEQHPFPASNTWGFSQHAPFYGLYLTQKRSIYLMQQRLKRHPFLALFDGADPNVSTARRANTTTPTQALYLMNDKFVHNQSLEFAERLMRAEKSPARRIIVAHLAAVSQRPDKDTVSNSLAFLNRYEKELRSLGKSRQQAQTEALAGLLRVVLIANEVLFVD